MKPEDAYDTWIRGRRAADVPAGFADRVMDAVRAEPARPPGLLLAIGASVPARVALVLLAALVCAFRFAGSLALLFVS